MTLGRIQCSVTKFYHGGLLIDLMVIPHLRELLIRTTIINLLAFFAHDATLSFHVIVIRCLAFGHNPLGDE